ncbi:hypothetical protein AJ80_01393 [Polytolypa hystricis UAMH7299]|uniref:Uncharacterized protein n=1 Tax=Polytolypa hystricis (strain UAMH7299) TaxID=1447883 RepID=A0A2B7Z194_POLH7|nr:hypothetical protein AJ80_01393 [Polytolypa hystricis UAMH7299]
MSIRSIRSIRSSKTTSSSTSTSTKSEGDITRKPIEPQVQSPKIDTSVGSFSTEPKLQQPFSSFEIPTIGPSPYSGFQYNQCLFELGVAPDEWTRFGADFANALQLRLSEKWAVWSVGVGVGIVSNIPLPVVGTASGYYAGKAMKDRSIAKKVRGGCDELDTMLRHWNEEVFKEKGFRVAVYVPKSRQKGPKDSKDEDEDLKEKNDTNKKGDNKGDKKEKKEAKKLEKYYTVVVEDLALPKAGVGELAGHEIMELETPQTPCPTYSSPLEPPAYRLNEFPAELDDSGVHRPRQKERTQEIYEMAA